MKKTLILLMALLGIALSCGNALADYYFWINLGNGDGVCYLCTESNDGPSSNSNGTYTATCSVVSGVNEEDNCHG